MVRLWFGGTPADFVIGMGADADIVDDTGTSTGTQGSAVLLPLAATAFDAYLDESLATVTTDLLDSSGSAITQVSPSTDFATRGTLPRFQGPDGHEGALWLSADGVTGYRLEPDTDVLYARLGTVEGALSTRTTSDLADVSATLPTDGQILVWNNALGVWEPGAASGTGTVTSVAGVSPDGSGAISVADLLAALGLTTLAADMAIIKSQMRVVLMHDGTGYPPKPSGFDIAERVGPTPPSSNTVDSDKWIQIVEEG